MDEEQKYNQALDAMCEQIRQAIFDGADAGISVEAMTAEADAALYNALDDIENHPNVAG